LLRWPRIKVLVAFYLISSGIDLITNGGSRGKRTYLGGASFALKVYVDSKKARDAYCRCDERSEALRLLMLKIKLPCVFLSSISCDEKGGRERMVVEGGK
jgi:hypothetical protein